MNKNNEDFVERLGLTKILNAAGTMTALGSSRVVPEAVAASTAISGRFVDINELQSHAWELIAKHTGAEAGFVASCSASAVTLGVAASMTHNDLRLIERLPDTSGMNNEVLLQAGHAINYGAPIEQAVRLAGAKTVMFGSSTEAHGYQLESILEKNPNITAGLYVVSHHTPLEGMIPLERFIKPFARRQIPVIVDLASEYDLHVSSKLGADYTIYSGHKYLGGPTSGIVAGKKDIVKAAYLQYRGIGRKMKVGKEAIAGSMAALVAWFSRDLVADEKRQTEILDLWQQSMGDAPGVSLRIVPDWTGNPIERLEMTIAADDAGLYAWELADRLRQEEPKVFVREQFIERNEIFLDPCNLEEGEEQLIADKILSILEKARKKGDGRKLSFDDYKSKGSISVLDWPA